MIFQKSLYTNHKILMSQYAEVNSHRDAVNHTNKSLNAMARQRVHNGGIIPQDVYQEFDNTTVERMRSDDGDAFLNDLMGITQPINIGKLVHKFRQSSDAGKAQTSMSGQVGAIMDQVEYSYDGTPVPIYDAGFGRNWREYMAMSSEGFDALIDDQRETVATVKEKLADGFLDGHKDKNGDIIVVDSLSWSGMRNDSRVTQVDLGAGGLNFDFTDTSATGAEIKAAFMQIRDAWYITNKCSQACTVYISREIISNWERKFSAQYDSKTILQELTGLVGVAGFKDTSKLSGNELMAFPLDRNKIKTVMGMGLNTVAVPRTMYNSNYNFVTWGAMGYEIRTDFAGNTCATYASA